MVRKTQHREEGIRPRRRTTYHHGDVRAAAVAAALAHLSTCGLPDFSLRSIAQDLNISHPSLYNHFDNREALVAAVAVVGFRDMAARIAALAAPGSEPMVALRNVGSAVVDFAREQPGLYRLMFGAELMRHKSGDPDLAVAMESPLRLVAAVVDRSCTDGLLQQGDPLLLAGSMWAAAHGLAMLVIDGRLGVLGPGLEDVLIPQTIDAMLAGLFPAPHDGAVG